MVNTDMFLTKNRYFNQKGFVIKPISKMKQLLLLTVFLNILLPGMALAEVVYINDTMRVGVRPQPSNDVGPIDVVMTGMKLEVLERSDGYIKIRSEKGIEGWIKEIYVSEKLPAQLELEKLQKEYQQLLSDSSKSADVIKAAEQARTALSKELNVLKEQNQDLLAELQELKKTTDGDRASFIYLWLGLLVVVLFIGGIVIGVSWHRQQVMKKLGGLRF